MFLAQLAETEENEKSLTFRILVWIPMLFAVVKLLAIKGGWHLWGPKVCGWMLFISCMVMEFITMEASRHQLSKDERDKALMLSQQWRKAENLQVGRQKTIEDALINPFLAFPCFNEVDGDFILSRITCTILLGFNAWPLIAPTAWSYFFPYFKYFSWLDSFLWPQDWGVLTHFVMILVELFMLLVFVIIPFVFFALFYCGLVYIVISPWILVLLSMIPVSLSSLSGKFESTPSISKLWQTFKIKDMDR
jgi:hypothetical protein